MGVSWSKRHHHLHNHRPQQDPIIPQSDPSANPISPTPYPPPQPPPSQPIAPPPRPPLPLQASNPPPQAQSPSYSFAANAPRSNPPPPEQHHYHPPPPPPQLPPPYSYNNNYSYNFSNYYNRPMNNNNNNQQYSHYRPYYMPQIGGWGPPVAPALPPPQMLPAVPYVDHQSAKKIKNDVNIHKETIRMQLDEQNGDCHLVSFTFDALVDGSITIFYFAKEGPHCTFTPVYPEIAPVKIPFQKGLSQKFLQPSGTGVDLGFFETDDLSKPFQGEDVFPLVISAESCMDGEESVNSSPHAQISQAVLEKKNGGDFHVKVMKQILWIDGVRYELREIFGIGNSDETGISDVDVGKECVICMTEVKNTAVLPCRHLCMCSDCSKQLRLQSNKCPICRQPIEELLEIKVDEESGASN